MDESKLTASIDSINHIKESGGFKNYIEYIEFPFYKNLVPHTRINFTFPLTVLIGKNGGGKSSTLHALFGAPHGKTCGDFWFSTKVDPIEESGDIPRYFYGFRENRDSRVKEVMKTRSKRSETEKKKADPDYWETTRPRKRDGMLEKERQAPVEKGVVYLDFRAEVSAFDKILHFSKENLEDRKELLRKRSIYLKRLFDGEPMRFKGQADEKMGQAYSLPDEMVKKINSILGKEYIEIKVAEHKLFKNSGTSVYLKSNCQGNYSEANAGSGEIAVVQLVRNIERATDYSLILLDEPEVSLHPAAQLNMKEYLLEVVKRKKLQIIIASHSPSLIEGLPNEAIKLFKTNENGKFFVRENVCYQEAFYCIEDKITDKKIIYCEDYAAKELIEKTLTCYELNPYFEVLYYSGGEKTLLKYHMPTIAKNDSLTSKVYMILDGDMDNGYVFDEQKITVNQQNDLAFWKQCILDAFGEDIETHPDGGNGGARTDQIISDYKKYLKYYSTNIFYLPHKSIPEVILLSSNYAKNNYSNILKNYSSVTNNNAKEVIQSITMDLYGDTKEINSVLKMMANMWSKEDSQEKMDMHIKLKKIME